MKKILLILLLFLLPLCLIPPTSAAYGDESPDSITSFDETLPDDVLYYPDSFVTSVELADYGEISDESYSADYILTNVLDGSAFNETTATDIEIWFEVDTTDGFEGFSYAHYLDVDSGTDVDLVAYDFDQDLFVKIDEPLPSTYAWMNGTIYDPDYWNTTHIAFAMIELSGNADLYWDYGEITLHRMTLADSDHYAEGFNDVSDWVEESFEGNDAMSSDGDVLTVIFEDNDNADQPYTNVPELGAGSYYAEIRYMTNVTGFNIALYSRTGDWGAGDLNLVGQLPASTDWITKKYYHPYQVECVYFYTVAVVDYELDVDYLRISPANETGWQHDGSTTIGINTFSGTGSPTSDGDLVTISGTTGQTFDFYPDVTTNLFAMDYGLYPFLELSIDSINDQGADDQVYLMRIYGTGGSWDHPDGYEADAGVFRFNLQATSGSISDVTLIRFYLRTTGDWFKLDYLKIYSIANFTVSDMDDEAVTNVAYVDNGGLVVSNAGDYIRFTYDITTAISSATYTVWNATLSSGVSGFRFRELSYTNVYHDMAETRGAIVSPTLISFEFLAYTGLEISAIKFIDTRDWQDIGEARFIFPIGWDPTFQFGFDSFFIFLGLIMIPVSTMYIVRGGRKEMSMDKLFYALIIFVMGLGFLIGGIMP